MIPITQEESFKVRKFAPNTYITGVNKEHMSNSKGYYMTCTRIGVKLLAKSNIKARAEYLEMLTDELQSTKRKLVYAKEKEKLDLTKKIKQLEEEIQELKLLDI